MANYIRAFRPGGTFFLTLVTERRAPVFAGDGARRMLHDALDRCRMFHPFNLDAIVLLPDHLHLLITLPEVDSDYPQRMNHLKNAFTRSYIAGGGIEQPRSVSRVRHRSRGIWQRRFWEHTIRDEEDLRRHFDFIHYNPVKHKYVDCPHAWPHSSFHRFIVENRYDRSWCCKCDGTMVPEMQFDDIAKLAGE